MIHMPSLEDLWSEARTKTRPVDSRFKESIRRIPALYGPIRAFHGVRQNLTIALSEYAARHSQESTVSTIAHVRENLARRGASWPSAKKLKILLLTSAAGWERSSLKADLEREHEVTYFSLEASGIERRAGDLTRSHVDRALCQLLQSNNTKYDLILSYLSGAEISSNTIRKLKELTVPIFSFHWDDRLLFWGHKEDGVWSGPASVAREYDLNLTNSPESLDKYRALGAQALFWPEGGHFQGEPEPLERDLDVLFIGTKYGIRERCCTFLRRQGVRISAYGQGWENGFVPESEMGRLIGRAKIVLGMGYIGHSSFQCLKARDFEVPIAGGLLLTSYHPALELVYRLGEEIESYNGFDECMKKVNWLLSHPAEAAEIRRKGYAAAVKRHSWCARIRQLVSETVEDEYL